MKPLKKYCPECDCDTSQRIESIKADDPDGTRVYICNRCSECTGYVEDEKLMEKLKGFWENK